MVKKRSVLRNFKLSEDEDAQLKADAYAHYMTVSAYLRWLVEKERKTPPRLCEAVDRAVDRAIMVLNPIYKNGQMLFGDWQNLHDAISAIYTKNIKEKEREG